VGVGQDTSFVWFSPERPNLPAVVGVPQDASLAWSLSHPVSFPPSTSRSFVWWLSPLATGVPQDASPVEPLPDVRSADAMCSQYSRPAGVAHCLQS
jgi:hypothetical protein